ncbi:MAG: VWA domain-containing protein [Promethearchaeota archaeon]|nr:MAG: VWA domain-containing protein [Candidatus Lokiarchaeota archaeon]
MKKLVYPFTAIVGQEEMKLALILNVINPLIGGVLIRGERGTGKSTAVRALASLLPEIEINEGCPFNDSPDEPEEWCVSCVEKSKNGTLKTTEIPMRVVNLPLGVTEDRVVGSLDIECAIKEGAKALEPGILAAANRNILYVDEINLLSDHIIDDLLDAAAFGVNIIEREGISVSHPSNFILVGSMNPEEGELRPQILDRLGLAVEVAAIRNPLDRLEILKNVDEFDSNPRQFIEKFTKKEKELQAKVIQAKDLLKNIVMPLNLMELIVSVCSRLQVETHRGEITVNRCAKALAALNNHPIVQLSDVEKAVQLALHSRIGRMGFTKKEEIENKIQDAIDQALDENPDLKKNNETGSEPIDEQDGMEAQTGDQGEVPEEVDAIAGEPEGNPGGDYQEVNANMEQIESEDAKSDLKEGKIGHPFSKDDSYEPKQEYQPIFREKKFQKIGDIFKFDKRNIPLDKRKFAIGKRKKNIGDTYGKYIRHKIPRERPKSIAFDASIRVAAPYQRHRKDNSDLAVNLKLPDIREKIFQYQAPLSIVFVLDASGSMFRLLKQMKSVILSLHDEAYQKRDRVGLVVFQGYESIVLCEPTVNLNLVVEKLSTVTSDSWTPLASGLVKGMEVLKLEKQRNSNITPVLVILTDGGSNVPLSSIPPPPFHNFKYYQIIEKELKEVSEQLRKEKIITILLWPSEAKLRGPSHRRMAESIARESQGYFYEIDNNNIKRIDITE